ncbi:MAG: hypothetical protein WC881_08010 [Elusimicrobiota bacterium]|jgi:hypothetical protein
MDIKCPACGFTSPESAQWCDFCKEPFNKKRAVPAVKESTPQTPAAPTPPAAPPAAQPAVSPTETSPATKNKAPAKKDPWAEIPPEFLLLDKGGDMPKLPPWFRYASWGVLAAVTIGIMILMGMYSAKRTALEDDASAQRRFSSSSN